MQEFDVAIVGGGIIGCSIAFELAQHRKKVCILEQNEVGREASWASAGMLVAQAETEEPNALFEWLCASREIYPQWCQQIQRTGGQDPGFHNSGTIALIGNNDEAERLADQTLEWQSGRGLRIEKLSVREVGELEPALALAHCGALYFHDDHHVNNRLLLAALVAACERLGVSVFPHHPVHQIIPGRCIQLKAGNRSFSAEQVVIATGAWTQRWEDALHCNLPLFPVKGEIVALKGFPIHSRHILFGNGVYIIPRESDFTLIGSTLDIGNFDKSVTAGGISLLLIKALEMFPSASAAPVVSTWAGLRPCTPDRLPVLGQIKNHDNVWVASGHYRNGILLAPLTARAVAEAMLGLAQSQFLSLFSPERFQQGKSENRS